MVQTTAAIKADAEFVFTDLASTNITETVTVAAKSFSFDCLRLGRLSSEELGDAGWMKFYKFSIRPLTDDVSALALEDMVTTAEGDMRVLNIDGGSAKVLSRIDLGDEWEPGRQ